MSIQESLSKTNFSEEWRKPTALQFAKAKYSKGNEFDKMFGFNPKQPDFELYPPAQYDKMKKLSRLEELMMKADQLKLLSMAPASPVVQVYPALDTQLEECQLYLDIILDAIQIYDVYGSPNVFNCEKDLEFYNRYIVKSYHEIERICRDTIRQAESDIWFAVRRLRISASKEAHSIKAMIKRTVESLVLGMAYPKKICTQAMKYSNRNEKIAKQDYKRVYGCELIDMGVIVSPFQPCLCGSPDAVVVNDGCITKIVEIKCPEICEEKPIIDRQAGRSNIKYLIVIEDEVKLRESHVYYIQCQVKMYVCGVNVCDLYIYIFFMWELLHYN
ncbi:hypothetical protein QAD02_008657 [Eretmocerus hayati]|uniref:Uncharacterized protein n=1 Tax=Eretmocerus hayati TaxID=131215 RepID=A0ACC2N730_9HYME|nr:hypothetical protein QAD02_008657 [Eretmocerus hayati]